MQNTEKYKAFSNPIEKEIQKIDKDGNENIIQIYYKAKFINNTRFMTSLFYMVNKM